MTDIQNKIKQAEKASRTYNKQDFSSFIVFCDNAEIYITVEKVYFYSFDYIYHICINYFNNKRELKEFTNKNDLINSLKNFRILKMGD